MISSFEFLLFISLLLCCIEYGQLRRQRVKLFGRELDRNVKSSNLFEDDFSLYDSWYTLWTKWSNCSHKCKQMRSRRCKIPLICANTVLKEERSCTGWKCKSKSFVIVNSSRDFDFPIDNDLDNLIFNDWSAWTHCGISCKTHRTRTCKFLPLCYDEIQREESYCYIEGSNCQLLFGQTIKTKQENLRIIPEKEAQCGKRNISTKDNILKIVGGKEAIKGKWPWQVAILNKHREHFCGGTLIAPQWVLTAAHCTRRHLFVRVAEYNLRIVESSEQEIPVEASYRHPNYDIDIVDSDIALLKLRIPVKYNQYVLPACLPSTELTKGNKCFVIGWGKKKNYDLLGTNILHEAELPIVDKDMCRKTYFDYVITNNMMCAGYKRGRIDTCAGDSGGPLLCKINGFWEIHGITSFGEGCGRKGKYGIYTKVTNFVPWINSTMVAS